MTIELTKIILIGNNIISSPLKLASSNCGVSSTADVVSPSFETVTGLLAMILKDWLLSVRSVPGQDLLKEIWGNTVNVFSSQSVLSDASTMLSNYSNLANWFSSALYRIAYHVLWKILHTFTLPRKEAQKPNSIRYVMINCWNHRGTESNNDFLPANKLSDIV